MTQAIFLGSFNPPHKGHYNCIKSVIESGVMERLNIDKIHIIPCKQNPNKSKYSVSFVARYKMCEYMFSDFINDRKVVIDDIENEIAPEYTYDLLKYFHNSNDKMINKDFWWIITFETFKELIDQEWYHSIQLRIENKFIIIVKDDYELKFIKQEEHNNENIRFVKLLENIDIHSTEIRMWVKIGESVEEFTNSQINSYIEENKLYKH